MGGRVFVNPNSGSDDGAIAKLRELFPDDEVHECGPEQLRARLSEAAADEVDFIGVAGGDGSLSTAAQALHHSPVPLLVVPAGTRNHFAKDLGITDVEQAARATHLQFRGCVDLGRVNDRFFVNNASVGGYAKIVRDREWRERHVSKRLANVLAAMRFLIRGQPTRLMLNGTAERVWLVFIGNGQYGEDLLSLTSRERLDTNLLDLRIVRAGRPFTRLRLMMHAVTGQLGQSTLVDQRAVSHCHIDSRDGSLDVAIDGEVQRMPTPLEFSVERQALLVLRPGSD